MANPLTTWHSFLWHRPNDEARKFLLDNLKNASDVLKRKRTIKKAMRRAICTLPLITHPRQNPSVLFFDLSAVIVAKTK